MKTINALVATAIFTLIISSVLVMPVHAQVDFDSWVGHYFSGNVLDRGVLVDGSGTARIADSTSAYGYIQCWDSNQSIFNIWLVEYDADTGTYRDAVPYNLQVLNGTPLDFVGYGFLPPGTIPEVEILTVILSFRGYERFGELIAAQLSTVAGCVIYNIGGGSYFAASESLRGRMFPVDRVPDEVQEKLLGLPPCP